MESKPMIDFLQTRQAHSTSGSPRAASHYLFRVQGRTITVEVYNSARMIRDGEMDPEKVKIAAEAFLELEAKRVGWSSLADRLVLNEAAMDAIVYRLGGNPRFSVERGGLSGSMTTE